MARFGRIFITGMFISFLGSLPLGTLNIAAMQISITDGLRPAFYFVFGCLITELVYVRLSLIAMDWIQRQQRLFKILEWVTLLIIVALAISSFYAAIHPSVSKNVILSSTLHRFWLGLFMSALNPVQIPFWFGWSTVLLSKKILLPQTTHYNIYIFGIGTGTMLGNLVFIFGGKLIASKINNNQPILNMVIGGIFAVTAIIQLWKMFHKKDVQHRLDHPEDETSKYEEKVDDINTPPEGEKEF